MRVKMNYLGVIRSKVGKKAEEYEVAEGSSLSDLLESLALTYGESLRGIFRADEYARLDPGLVTTVNGVLRNPLQEGSVKLREGDRVALMTLISGG